MDNHRLISSHQQKNHQKCYLSIKPLKRTSGPFSSEGSFSQTSKVGIAFPCKMFGTARPAVQISRRLMGHTIRDDVDLEMEVLGQLIPHTIYIYIWCVFPAWMGLFFRVNVGKFTLIQNGCCGILLKLQWFFSKSLTNHRVKSVKKKKSC